MLAALRASSRSSRRPLSAPFSTTARVAQASPLGVFKELGQVLSDTKNERDSSASRTKYAAYGTFFPGKPLYPNSLTYKAAVLKQRFSKKPSVAPPPSVTRNRDTFHQLRLDPRHFTSNPSVLAHFVTEMGKIKGRDTTELTAKSQRLMGRTIRRAKMMGIMPILSKGYIKYY